uniref:Nebulette n=1 Tax=Amphiprion percula TaxID=161767 RepID=A0A3P8RZK8_AMPPE
MGPTVDIKHANIHANCHVFSSLQVKYKEDFAKMKGQSLFVPGAELIHSKNISAVISEVKYKGNVKMEISSSLYSLLPETTETHFVREMSDMQSEKFYKEKFNREKGKSSYSNMKTLPEVEHAMEVTRNQSEPVNSDGSLLDRTDIQHAKEVSKLASQVTHIVFTALSLQVKYKESFDRNLKGQKPCYNPLDCLSFKHTQAAAALASQVEYKKKYEQTKAQYHIALDTAEQLHHKENAALHSQVKYREEYERNKGRSQMEFADTQTYKVSKEAQKMQSEKEYRRDFEQQMKGKALLDVDQTPGYLTARHAGSLISEKQYRKDLEQQVKGRGLSGRVQAAGRSVCLCVQKEYRRNLERDVVGKGMELSADVLEIQRAKRASEIQSQVPAVRTVFQTFWSHFGQTVSNSEQILNHSGQILVALDISSSVSSGGRGSSSNS